MSERAYPALQNAVVLCIDDNEDELESEKSLLEIFGYTVLTAPSGSVGLELASMHSVDVVIVDYSMPEMNGQELAVEMKRLRPLVPIILLTGAVNVPKQALNLVDALVLKDRLASQLLPAIAQLRGRGSISPLKVSLVAGLLLVVLGISLLVPVPHSMQGIKAGDMNMGVETSHSERVWPIITAVLIAGGIALAIAGARTERSEKLRRPHKHAGST
jgi:CheY-like chemotaxis protein